MSGHGITHNRGTNTPAYRSEIDGLRAIAVLSVVFYHANIPGFSGGFVGVDIFFVISGFLITSIIVKAERAGGFSYLDFYVSRARRILPALLFMTVIVTAICLAVLLPADLVDYGKVLIYTIVFGANFKLTATPAYFDSASLENPLLHMWSLSVEEQFYLVWPTLLVAILAGFSPRRLRIAVFLLAAISLISAEILVHSWPKSAFYHLPSRGWELLAGAILAMGIVPKVRARAIAEALSFFGLILMIAPVFLYNKETAFPGLAALPPVLGCAFLIHAESAVKTWIGAVLSLRPVVFIGLISYSLYLWHWPVFALPSYLLMREMTFIEAISLVAVAVLLAALSWHFIEKPFRKRPSCPSAVIPPSADSWRHLPLTRTAYSAIVLITCLIASGSYFQESKGAHWRLPPGVLALSQMTIDKPHLVCTQKTEFKKDFVACEMGRLRSNGERPKVILWGDSHAMHYERLIASVYGEGVAYLHNDCPPILNVYLVFVAIERSDEACLQNRALAFQKILEDKPDVVILAGRWTYSEPFPYGRENHPTRYFLRSGNDTRELSHSRKVFAEELSRTVDRLAQAGIHVVLMGQVPEVQIRVAHCLAISRYIHRDETPCLSIARSEVEKRQANVSRVLRSIEASNPNVKVFWPIHHMCENERCYVVRDGNVLYRDTNHLSSAGALSLVEAFKSSLPDLITREHQAESALAREASSRLAVRLVKRLAILSLIRVEDCRIFGSPRFPPIPAGESGRTAFPLPERPDSPDFSSNPLHFRRRWRLDETPSRGAGVRAFARATLAELTPEIGITFR